MRESGETSTMRTLNIDLQLEAMKHETKAQPVTNLRKRLTKRPCRQKLPLSND